MAKLICGLLLLCSCYSLAQTKPASTVQSQDKAAVAETGLTELPDISSSNQIPLLENRFRIDYQVEEITLIFFRKKGSPSVILVKPDGSKVYVRNAKAQQVEWHDDKTYDLIKIVKPTPGPWQAIGEILPESRIMVLTDIDLQVDPLPTDLMAGETLKVTAKLTNGGEPVNVRDFRDILQLDVLLISTQKPEYDNHQQTVVQLTSFKDDGKNFDEKPRDAIFTGEFNLDFPAGEWIPKYIVKTPLYTRELMQKAVVIQRSPVQYQLTEALTDADKHQLIFALDPASTVEGKSIALQGRIRFPNGEVQSYTLGEMAEENRLLLIANAGVGTYRVENTLFGRTKTGREFVLNLSEYTFAAVGPKIAVPEIAAPLPDAAAQAATKAATVADSVAAAPVPEPVADFPLGWVIAANMLILFAGGGAVLLVVNDNARRTLTMLMAKVNPAMLLKRRKSAADLAAQAAAGDAQNAAAAKKGQKNNGGADILDLSLPDD